MIIQGLNELWAEDRMPLPDVLARLEAMGSSAARGEPAVDIVCTEPRRTRVQGAYYYPHVPPSYPRPS